MRNRLLKSVAVALTLTATTVPLAQATGPDDGYKSGYPQLHAIHTYKETTSGAASTDEGYRSGYPHSTQSTPSTHNLSDPDDRPQLPLERRGHRRRNSSRRDFLAAAAGLALSRRHQDRRLRRANQPRESPIHAPPPVGRGTSRISSPSTQTPM